MDRLTVREYIERLKELDQNKGIWVNYDCYTYFPPTPDDVAEEDDDDYGIQKGDYIINAW